MPAAPGGIPCFILGFSGNPHWLSGGLCSLKHLLIADWVIGFVHGCADGAAGPGKFGEVPAEAGPAKPVPCKFI